MIYVWITLFLLAIVVFWCFNVIGLPGNWLSAALVGLWMWIGPAEDPWRIGWITLVAVISLAIIGEVIEFLAGMIGAQRVGGSKKGVWLSLLGSLVGGILGAFFGIPIPIPVVGIIVSSLLFACAGAMIGAYVGEKWEGRTDQESMHIGAMAFVGRFFGTAAKMALGSLIALTCILALLF